MTVAGQQAVNYSYDNADRLTQITQLTTVVGFSNDAASRRTLLTLPNGITVSYTYDDASRLMSMTYQLGQTQLGNLTYTYDNAGRVTAKGGTWARTNLRYSRSMASRNGRRSKTPSTASFTRPGATRTRAAPTTTSWSASATSRRRTTASAGTSRPRFRWSTPNRPSLPTRRPISSSSTGPNRGCCM
jgi:YD repeat-containing protein